jgi:hypothetical protein
MATSDSYYWPYIDDEAIATTITALVKYVEVTELIARARFSDPDVGGDRILPYQQKSIQLTDADLLITAVRTPDPIAT